MTKSSLPKIQHYVPQFILKNFCIDNTSQVFVFDKKQKRIFKTNIKNVAAENGFYDINIFDSKVSIEEGMGELETTGSKVIKKILDNETLANITEYEKGILSYFIAAQFLRVKQKRITEMQLSDIVENQLRKMGVTPDEASGIYPKSIGDIKMAHIANMGDNILEFGPYFNDKTWVLFKAPKDTQYYISDNPVTLKNEIDYSPRGNLGLLVTGIEIYFPLSSKFLLAMLCRSHEDKIQLGVQQLNTLLKFGAFKPSGIQKGVISRMRKHKHAFDTGEAILSRKESVLNKNSLQVMYSSRFVFSKENNFYVAKKMIEENSEFQNPPKIREK